MTETTRAEIEWTAARGQIRSLLQDLHSDAGGLYTQAVEAFSFVPFSRPRLMIGSHCIRELVPTLLELQQIARPPRANDTRAAKDLAATWAAHGLRLDPGPEEASYAENDLRPVPQAVYVAARATAAAGAEGSQNSRKVIALFALGQESAADTAPLRRLHKAIGAFTGWCHKVDYTQPSAKLPHINEVHQHLLVVEEALLTRFGNRADRVNELRDRLRSANRKAEGDSGV